MVMAPVFYDLILAVPVYHKMALYYYIAVAQSASMMLSPMMTVVLSF
jgi:hypothetical protein